MSAGRELGARVVRRSASDVEVRVERLRQRAFLIVQVSIAAALAWWIARDVLDHPQPFFAPVAVIASLGLSYGQRLRRVVEVTLGVALGVAVAEVFVHVAGTGFWQIGLAVLVSMSLAVLLDGGPMLVTQAAVQSVIVISFVSPASVGVSRVVDAMVGGAVALLAAVVAPQTPLRRPRQEAALILDGLSDMLHDGADAARTLDLQRAEAVLTKARSTDQTLVDLRTASAEGLAIVHSSPFRRRERAQIERVAELAEPLDHAVRNARVLFRRIVVAARYRDVVPEEYLELVDELGVLAGRLADTLRSSGRMAELRGDLKQLGAASASLGSSTSMSSVVVLAQVRSMVVDLLELTGMDDEAAAAAVRPVGDGPEGVAD